MDELTFDEIRNNWCKDQGFDGYEDYKNSLTISDDEYEDIAEVYAAQWKHKLN